MAHSPEWSVCMCVCIHTRSAEAAEESAEMSLESVPSTQSKMAVLHAQGECWVLQMASRALSSYRRVNQDRLWFPTPTRTTTETQSSVL